MKRLWKWMPLSILLLMFAGTASATPINFQFDSSTAVGGALPTVTYPTTGFPVLGSGDIDFTNGTGTLMLNDYSMIVDVGGGALDARLDISGWTQTITSIDASGNIASTGAGTQSCTVLGGLGSLVCPSVPTTVAGWPAPNGTLPSSAVLDDIAQTITVIDNSNAQAGTITTTYSYSIVPEPGTALLMGMGLMGLATVRRQRA